MSYDDRPKLIYLALRHPRFTPEAFIGRWREHAALGMRQPRWRNVALYLHCDPAEGMPAEAVPVHCDGVAVVVYRSEAARQAHIGDGLARQTMKADELATFAQPVARTSLLLRQEVRRPGPLEAWRLFAFRDDVAGESDAVSHAVSGLGRSALPAGEIGHIRNHVTAVVGAWACAGVDEFSCANLGPLVALARSLAATATPEARLRMAMTHTVVLHDRPVLPVD